VTTALFVVKGDRLAGDYAGIENERLAKSMWGTHYQLTGYFAFGLMLFPRQFLICQKDTMFRKKDTQHFDSPKKVKTVGREATEGSDPWKLQAIIFDGGDQGYSIAIGSTATGKRVCAIRWNGDYDHEGSGDLTLTGTPAQGNYARWFVLPEFLVESTISATYEYMKANAIGWLKKDR